MSVISGKAYWASVTSPNTTFDADGTWSIDVCNLDEANKAIAEKDGLTIKNKSDDRGDFVNIKRHVKRKDGNMKSGKKLKGGKLKEVIAPIKNKNIDSI